MLKDKNFALDTFANSWNTQDSTKKKETFYSANSLNSSRIMKSMCGVSIANVRTLSWSSITICLVGRKRIENIWVFYHVCLVERIKKWKHGKLITIIPILFLKSAGNLDILPSSSFLPILERTFVGHERTPPPPFSIHPIFSPYQTRGNSIFSPLFPPPFSILP